MPVGLTPSCYLYPDCCDLGLSFAKVRVVMWHKTVQVGWENAAQGKTSRTRNLGNFQLEILYLKL